jgi:hypothetical protein
MTRISWMRSAGKIIVDSCHLILKEFMQEREHNADFVSLLLLGKWSI